MSAPASRRRLRTYLAWPLIPFAVLIVLFDDAFRRWVAPLAARLARLRLLRRIEAAVARLPPYPTLALFILPLAVIEPLKIYGLYLFGEGRWIAGCLTFVVAKVVGIGLAERLFAISRDKLLSIGWFAKLHARIMALKDAVHVWLQGSKAWQTAVRMAADVRRLAQRSIAWVRGLFHGPGLVSTARRFTMRTIRR